MNRILFSSTSFILIIILCFFGIYKIKSLTEPIISEIDKVILYSYDGNLEKASENLENACEQWEDAYSILEVFLMHTDLKEINEIFVRIFAHIENKDSSSLYIESKELIYRLEYLLLKEKFSFKNIF